jgi:hypothetical protein
MSNDAKVAASGSHMIATKSSTRSDEFIWNVSQSSGITPGRTVILEYRRAPRPNERMLDLILDYDVANADGVNPFNMFNIWYGCDEIKIRANGARLLRWDKSQSQLHYRSQISRMYDDQADIDNQWYEEYTAGAALGGGLLVPVVVGAGATVTGFRSYFKHISHVLRNLELRDISLIEIEIRLSAQNAKPYQWCLYAGGNLTNLSYNNLRCMSVHEVHAGSVPRPFGNNYHSMHYYEYEQYVFPQGQHNMNVAASTHSVPIHTLFPQRQNIQAIMVYAKDTAANAFNVFDSAFISKMELKYSGEQIHERRYESTKARYHEEREFFRHHFGHVPFYNPTSAIWGKTFLEDGIFDVSDVHEEQPGVIHQGKVIISGISNVNNLILDITSGAVPATATSDLVVVLLYHNVYRMVNSKLKKIL